MPRITKRFVDSISPTAKETEYWDDKLPGFGIRVKPSGVISYVIRYRTLSGDQRRLTLGQHGKLTPEQARNLAEDRFAEIKAGGDPSAHRQEKRAAPTLRELAERYMKDYVEVHHKAGTARETRRLITRSRDVIALSSNGKWFLSNSESGPVDRPGPRRNLQPCQLPIGLRHKLPRLGSEPVLLSRHPTGRVAREPVPCNDLFNRLGADHVQTEIVLGR